MVEQHPYRGARTPDQRGKWNVPRSMGIMSDQRQAWVTLVDFEAILFVGQEGATYEPDTPPVRIELRVPGRSRNPVINLTKMTAPELEEFATFMQHAIDKARPVCGLLDQRAKEAFDDGDDGHTRLYRPIPQFFDRERFVEEHREGLPGRSRRLVDGDTTEGSDDLPGPDNGSGGDSGSGLHDGGAGVGSSGPPHEGEDDVVSQHHEPEAGSPPEVREVPRVPELSLGIQAPEGDEGRTSPFG